MKKTKQGIRDLSSLGPKQKPRFSQDTCHHKFLYQDCDFDGNAIYRCDCGKEEKRPVFVSWYDRLCGLVTR